MIEHIQAVIFDIDGTLVDSMGVWYDIDVEYFKLLGIPMPPTLQKDIEGMSFTETAVYFKETFQLTEKTIDDIKLDWIRMAHEKYLYEIKSKPGAKEFIKFLKEKGIKTGCATSNEKSLAMAALQPHGWSDKMNSVRTACEVCKGKPAPDIYLKVAEDLGVKPENCLVFEDIPNGMRAGKAAGMTVIGVEDEGAKKYRSEIDEICDYFITDYYDMLEGKIEVEYELSSGK
ncbi:MAG: HAD family phosphatase [Lachnospiraceae bacterium]|nr:HAD family phosphatase [Lachnospiraceae bacterium]MEE1015264.1 HAD family phosphatase [Lachnospiraceae bacterium]